MTKWVNFLLVGLCVSGLALAQTNTNAEAKLKPELVIYPAGMSPEILQSVSRALDAVVRTADDVDTSEKLRIRGRARDAVIAALQVHGYFNSQVDLTVEVDEFGETWEVAVQSGEVSRVSSISQQFDGAINQDKYAQRREELKKNWLLKKGDVFVNDQWSKAKSNQLSEVMKRDFYLARYTLTQAFVLPQDHEVELVTEIDSGPAVVLGDMQIEGLHYVPKRLIERYVRYQKGEAYDADKLAQWQQQLMATQYFRGVFVTLPSGQYLDDKKQLFEMPVKVSVTEAPSSTVTASLGWTDESGPRAEAVYQQHVLFKHPITLSTGMSVDKNQQKLYLDLLKPPNLDGTKDSFGTVFSHSDILDERVRRVAFGWRRTHQFKFDEQSRVNYKSNWGTHINIDNVQRSNQKAFFLPSIVLTWNGMRIDVDDVYNPRQGNLQAVGLGVGIGSGAARYRPFYRADMRYQYWYPVGRRDVLTARTQIGKVFASEGVTFPYDFGYRAGGARTLRGYRYLEFGQEINGAVIGARAMAVAGIEYMHYLNDMWGISAFVDVGNTAPSLKQIKPVWGYGIGGFAKTPAGPFEVYLAWGQKDRKLRLHFSIGMAF